MKYVSMLLPLAVAAAFAIIVTARHRRLPPVLAARAIMVSLVAMAAAAVPTLWIVSFGYVSHLPFLGGRLDWCADALGVHDRVPAWLGLSTLLVTVIGFVRLGTALREYRRLRHDHPGAVEIAEHAAPFAFTLPGRGGHVVMSTGLVELLDESEQGVVLAHESAHARSRHDRYLLATQLIAALMPPLRPLAARLHFSLERCADEVAVAHCGDRKLVARTLGKVALRNVTPAFAMSFAGLGVPARVAALLAPPAIAPRSTIRAALWAAISVTGALAMLQVHHVAELIVRLCAG